jgi:glycosyltransferase involved in cell wall biosynthesis
MDNNKKKIIDSVSIIVPVFNEERKIGRLIGSLVNLNYPKDLIEIIIVDNNSSDLTKQIVEQYPVKLLSENCIQSSYAARNKGIKKAIGDVIAFTDADCVVDSNWVLEGVNALRKSKSDLIAGRIKFYYSEKKPAAEFFDSIVYMQNEIYVKERKSAATANLFVPKKIFDHVGLFPPVKSSGDGIWTKKATSMGFILNYEPQSIVFHSARNLRELIKKGLRVGRGATVKKIIEGKSRTSIIFEAFKYMRPSRLETIDRLIEQRGQIEMKAKRYRIWAVGNLCSFFVGIGLIIDLIRVRINFKG